MATTTIEELARLRRAKAEIKEEIEAKGVEVPSFALLDTYDDYVRQIQGATEPAEWGGITGDIEDQTDLMAVLEDKYEKPENGIPATDLEEGVIPDVSDFITNTVNDLANYYLKSETYTQSEVDALIGAISQFHYEIAQSTSAVASPAGNVLYLIGPTGDGADKYEEYIYVSTAQTPWVKIGDTTIDLSSYYQFPSGGIPDTDLSSAVQTSLGKADSAIQNVKTLGGVAVSGTGDVILSGNLASGENLVFDCGSYTALVRIGDTYIFLRDMSSMTALSIVIGPDDITVKAEFVTNPKKYVGLTTASATSYSIMFLSGTPVAVTTASGFPSPASSTAPKVALFVSDIVDNLTSTDAKAPLSAKQGKALNDAIGNKADSSSVPVVTSMSATDMDDIWDSVFGS